MAAIFVVVLVFLRAQRQMAVVLWTGVLVTLVLRLYVAAGLMAPLTSYIVLAVVTAFVALGRLVVVVRDTRRYNCYDVVAALALGALAIYVFLFDNTKSMHGWFHVLAAAALSLVIDSQRNT
jgi:peptidoglycan/LPS O-acetylase OafA/YrhL